MRKAIDTVITGIEFAGVLVLCAVVGVLYIVFVAADEDDQNRQRLRLDD